MGEIKNEKKLKLTIQFIYFLSYSIDILLFRFFIHDLNTGARESHDDLVHDDGGEVLGPLQSTHQLRLCNHSVHVGVNLCHDLVHHLQMIRHVSCIMYRQLGLVSHLLHRTEALGLRVWYQVVESRHNLEQFIFADDSILIAIKNPSNNLLPIYLYH